MAIPAFPDAHITSLLLAQSQFQEIQGTVILLEETKINAYILTYFFFVIVLMSIGNISLLSDVAAASLLQLLSAENMHVSLRN